QIRLTFTARVTCQPGGDVVEIFFQVCFFAVFPCFGPSAVDPVVHSPQLGMAKILGTGRICQEASNPLVAGKMFQVGGGWLLVFKFISVSMTGGAMLAEESFAFREGI